VTRTPAYRVVDHFLDETTTARLLADIEGYLAVHDAPLVHREHAGRGLHYQVIDGNRVERFLPSLEVLYRQVNGLVNDLLAVQVVPLGSHRVGLNVNITPPGGSYRWHYDRNALTATLYLNHVSGGDLELCPNYRISRGNDARRPARAADRLLQVPGVMRLFGRKVRVHPEPGVLVVMRGDRCLHSVSEVTGRRRRINVVMAYDEIGRVSQEGDELDTYLYSQDDVRSADPNYRS
jgi:hypothetical protein